MHHKEWQIAYLQELTDQILQVVEEAGDDVPAYLKEHRQAKFAPEVLLRELEPEQLAKARAGIEFEESDEAESAKESALIPDTSIAASVKDTSTSFPLNKQDEEVKELQSTISV